MKSTLCRILLRSVLVFAFATCGQASKAEQDPSATVKAANQLAKWFVDLLHPFQELGALAERQRLVDDLVGLNKSLFELEQEKRYAILALRRRPLVQAELRNASESLVTKIFLLRQSLQTLAPTLRLTYRAGADECIDLLSDALVSRKAFVSELPLVTEALADREALEAQAAVDALALAQRRLADAIAALQKQ